MGKKYGGEINLTARSQGLDGIFGRDWKPFRSYKRSWATACRKAGLRGKIPHDFRSTAVRNLFRPGIPEEVAMQMTGHHTRSVFERYNIDSQGDLSEAAKKLDSYTAGTLSGTVYTEIVQSAEA
jgi:integrase